MLSRHPVTLLGAALALATVLSQCGSARDGETTGTVRQGIIGGQPVTDPNSATLFLINSNVGGSVGDVECTATLIAPTLAVTARHCVAELTIGTQTCTAQGTLATGNGAGALGQDYPPSDLQFYTNAQVMAGTALVDMPTVVGAQIISTNAPSICADDLAFVVLSQPITGITPASIRLIGPTYTGESVSVYGYGYTEVPEVTVPALRVRDDADIVGVGPTTPPPTTQPAPLRAVRVGPDEVTCNGDSGGGIFSNVTGALIAIASIGEAANVAVSLSCSSGGLPDTTGPLLSDYSSLALQAFEAADASPTLESEGDASVPDTGSDAMAEAQAADAQPSGAGPVVDGAAGGGCSTAMNRRDVEDGSRSHGAVLLAMATAAVAAGRRRRCSG
ncbi:MAG TPA: trypsin-like serine protease [Polyangiaceae bacterium]|nr:trypsin-like serine protease [Polyangiaceae bacterium]